MPAPDLKRLAVLLDMVITSNQAGEVDNALRALVQHMRKTKLRGSDFTEAMVERDRALDLVKRYAARLDQLEAAYKQLQARGDGAPTGTLAQALWQDAGMPRTVESRHAQWALALGIHLTPKETDFLGSCSRRSRLSQAQRNWLQDIIRNAAARTGQTPPL